MSRAAHIDPGRPSSLSVSPEPSNRRQTAEAAGRTLAQNPVVGKGLGSFPGGWDGVEGQAHMTALEVAAVQGPSALFALAGLVAVVWARRR